MTRSETLWQWTKCVSRNMPELTGSQARLLAWWSYGIALTGSCGRLTVATFLGLLRAEKVANIEQRLYEWCLDAEEKEKGGRQRRELDLAVCQVALLRWILRLWVGTHRSDQFGSGQCESTQRLQLFLDDALPQTLPHHTRKPIPGGDSLLLPDQLHLD